jgi:hypothetical protein
VSHPLIESITNEDLVSLMRVASEQELLEEDLPSGRRTSTGLDGLESGGARQASVTNRVLFC